MEETQYQLDDLEVRELRLSKRLDRIETALHELLENPGGLFAASARARDILNSEL